MRANKNPQVDLDQSFVNRPGFNFKGCGLTKTVFPTFPGELNFSPPIIMPQIAIVLLTISDYNS